MSENFRCPKLTCTGWVSEIDDFWGCGVCGQTWFSLNEFFNDIAQVVEGRPHRAAVYLKAGQDWMPAPINNEPLDYYEQVNAEWDDDEEEIDVSWDNEEE